MIVIAGATSESRTRDSRPPVTQHALHAFKFNSLVTATSLWISRSSFSHALFKRFQENRAYKRYTKQLFAVNCLIHSAEGSGTSLFTSFLHPNPWRLTPRIQRHHVNNVIIIVIWASSELKNLYTTKARSATRHIYPLSKSEIRCSRPWACMSNKISPCRNGFSGCSLSQHPDHTRAK